MPLKYITQFVSPNVFKFWVFPMFSYGFVRTANADYPAGLELLGYRTVWSLLQGCLYVTPMGMFRLLDTVNRAEVQWKGLDRTKYPSIYTDGIATNPNVIL